MGLVVMCVEMMVLGCGDDVWCVDVFLLMAFVSATESRKRRVEYVVEVWVNVVGFI